MPDDINDSVARRLTDPRLADDLRRIADDVRWLPPAERASRIREAADRLDKVRMPQTIVTLPDGQQVAWLNGEWHVRSRVSDSWTLPLDESRRPHEPRTFYVGEW